MKINWFFKPAQIQDRISVGDYVTSNGKYAQTDYFFIHGPKKVIRVKKGTKDSGGFFVYCRHDGTEYGFYINGLKKINL